jgi:parallel beta-helix repeat protein
MMRSRTSYHKASTTAFGLAIAFLAFAGFGEATTFYVAKTGSDSASGSLNAPFRNINKGVSVLKPGDVLYIRAGTYDEWLNTNIPGGTSWSAPVTVAAYPGESVTLRPALGSDYVIVLRGSAKKYIIIQNLALDGANIHYDIVKLTRPGSTGTDSPNHVRFVGCEVKNGPLNAFALTYGADYNEFLNLNVHNNGKLLQGGLYSYGWYLRGSYNLIQGSQIYDQGSSGIQIYSGNSAEPPVGNIVSGNTFYSNDVLSIKQGRGAGIIVASGSGHLIHDNIVRNNYFGIFLSYSSKNKVYNNTVSYNSSAGIFIDSGSYGDSITTNRVYGNGGGQIMNYGSSTSISGNLYTP